MENIKLTDYENMLDRAFYDFNNHGNGWFAEMTKDHDFIQELDKVLNLLGYYTSQCGYTDRKYKIFERGTNKPLNFKFTEIMELYNYIVKHLGRLYTHTLNHLYERKK